MFALPARVANWRCARSGFRGRTSNSPPQKEYSSDVCVFPVSRQGNLDTEGHLPGVTSFSQCVVPGKGLGRPFSSSREPRILFMLWTSSKGRSRLLEMLYFAICYTSSVRPEQNGGSDCGGQRDEWKTEETHNFALPACPCRRS